MRRDTASQTAAVVAATRALGAQLPAEAQLALDPYAWRFVAPQAARVLGASGPMTAAWRAVAPLRRWVVYMQVRTRVIDDAVRAFARGGGAQLVLLGAGYDCRAHRLAAELGDARVFEVDHPATQRRKRRILAGDARSVGSVAYLPWDFERQPMAELPGALCSLGLDREAPTLTIWEGVTMYLTQEAIEASVAAMRAYKGAGSRVVLTYFDSAHVSGQTPWLARLARAAVAGVGEPWRWGWAPAELGAWLASRRFALASDESMPRAAARLLPTRWARDVAMPVHGGRRFISFEHVAIAEVAS